jgi:hypothetical protein
MLRDSIGSPVTSKLCAIAMFARFWPRRAAIRRNWAAKEVSLARDAAHAASLLGRRSHLLPFRVRPLRRWPALSSCPGHRGAQLAR